MTTWTQAFSIRPGLQLNVELYEYGGAGLDVENNRSLHRANIWLNKNNLAMWTYYLTAHDSKSYGVSGPGGSVGSGSGQFAYDFRPSGSQVTVWMWAFDIWIPHNSTGGGNASVTSTVADSTLGTATTGGSRAMTQLFTIPATPTSPAIDNIGSTDFRYNATPGDDGGTPVTDIEVQYATNSGFTTGVATLTPGSLTDVSVTGLSATTHYWVRSRVKNVIGWSSWSSSTDATTIDVPGIPTLDPDTVDAHSIAGAWTDPVFTGGTLTGRQVQLCSDAACTTVLETVTASSTAFTLLTTLVQHTTYWIRGRAQNSEGWGAWSTAIAVQTSGPPLSYWRHDGTSMKHGSIWRKIDGVWRSGWIWRKIGGNWYRGK